MMLSCHIFFKSAQTIHILILIHFHYLFIFVDVFAVHAFQQANRRVLGVTRAPTISRCNRRMTVNIDTISMRERGVYSGAKIPQKSNLGKPHTVYLKG